MKNTKITLINRIYTITLRPVFKLLFGLISLILKKLFRLIDRTLMKENHEGERMKMLSRILCSGEIKHKHFYQTAKAIYPELSKKEIVETIIPQVTGRGDGPANIFSIILVPIFIIANLAILYFNLGDLIAGNLSWWNIAIWVGFIIFSGLFILTGIYTIIYYDAFNLKFWKQDYS